MKELKDIILDKRIKSLEVDGKQVPDKYIAVFNSYLEQIAESLTFHDKQVKKKVCEEIKNRSAKSYSGHAFNMGKDVYSYTVCDFVLDEIVGEK